MNLGNNSKSIKLNVFSKLEPVKLNHETIKYKTIVLNSYKMFDNNNTNLNSNLQDYVESNKNAFGNYNMIRLDECSYSHDHDMFVDVNTSNNYKNSNNIQILRNKNNNSNNSTKRSSTATTTSIITNSNSISSSENNSSSFSKYNYNLNYLKLDTFDRAIFRKQGRLLFLLNVHSGELN